MSDGRWILALRLRRLGDVVATLEALRAIHARGDRVALVADRVFHPLLARWPFLDRLLDSPPRLEGAAGARAYARWIRDVRALRPAVALDFHGSWRSAIAARLSGAPVRAGWRLRGRDRFYTHVEPRARRRGGAVVPRTSVESALALARHAGIEGGADRPPRLEVTPAERQTARARLVEAGVDADVLDEGRLVGLNPGRSDAVRGWTVERFVELARALVARGWGVVVDCGPGEEPAARAIAGRAGTGVVVAPVVALADVPALLAWQRALVTIDSGLKHLAVCVGVPTVTLFGGTDPREWHMGGARDRVLWKGLSCAPCRRRDCPVGSPCMDHAPGAVLEVLEEVLA